jgi:hypothetical protein
MRWHMETVLRDLSYFHLVTIVELNKIKFTETSKLSKYRDAELRDLGHSPRFAKLYELD